MKVLQINKYHYLKGGSDKVYLDTSDLLRQNGHEVIHFSMESPANWPSPTSAYFVRDPQFLQQKGLRGLLNMFRYMYSRESARKLEQLIVNEKPDIAHLHIFFGELSLSILPVLKRAKIPTVMTLHDFKMICPVYTMLDPYDKICDLCARQSYAHAVLKRCNKRSLAFSGLAALESWVRDHFFPYEKYIDHFVAVSHFSREKHLEYRPQLASRISIIGNYVHQTPPPKKKLNKKPYFVYAGRLSRPKGIWTLVQAFQQFPDFQLVVAGDGPELTALLQYTKEQNCSNIEFRGFLASEDLHQLLSNAYFTIIPSWGYESFGLSALESMSLGTPVIASAIGGLPEVVGKGGLLIPPREIESLRQAVLKVVGFSKNDYLEVCELAWKIAQPHNSHRYYQELLAVYTHVINNNLSAK